MEIPVTGLAVMRSRKVVNHEERSITRLKPEVLGYVLSANPETGRVTCLMSTGELTTLYDFQAEYPADSVYVRFVGQREGAAPPVKGLSDLVTHEPVFLAGCDEQGHFLPITRTDGSTALTCVCGRLTVHSAGLRTVWEE